MGKDRKHRSKSPKKWEKDIQKNLKKKFDAWRHKIEEFAKRVSKRDYSKGQFTPVSFKVSVDANGALTYTIQF